MEELTHHFKPLLLSAGVDVDLILDQWTVLKSRLYQQMGHLEKITWPVVNRMLGHECPHILQLFDLILAIPSSSADCERGFSVMKLVKTDWRARLKAETLCDLLTVQLNSPDIMHFDLNSPDIMHFDPSNAIEVWHADSLCSRRPEFTRKDQAEKQQFHRGL